MLFVVERFDAALLEGIDDRCLDRHIERTFRIEIGFDHGFVQESLFIWPIGEIGVCR